MMAVEHSVMSDDLLRQIIGVGQVDLLIGVPQFDDAPTAAAAVAAVRAAFRTQFPRQRAALLHAGGADATLAAAVSDAWGAAGPSARGGLRTTHLITARGAIREPGGSGASVILAAADLLRAAAVVILDPDAADLTPERVAALAAPLGDARIDLLAPLYARPADEGLLVTQMLRPLTRALFGTDLREPLLPEFGCSGRFTSHCVQTAADLSPAIVQSHYWLAAEALAGTFTVRQQLLGSHRQTRRAARAGLPALFQEIVGAAFLVLDRHDQQWLSRHAVADTVPAPLEAMQADPAAGTRALASFAADVGNLAEILTRILSPDVHTALRAATAAEGGPRLPATLWAELVSEFLLAHHHAVMLREHVVQALLPLYVARTGSFLAEHAGGDATALDGALDALCHDFERFKPRIIERWTSPAVR
jgi:hypothetical protein